MSGFALSQPSPQFETSRPASVQQLALDLFENGKAAHDGIGMPQDFEKARMLYLKAADLGSTQALINLGYLYFTGQGVDADLVKARAFYEAAARLGSLDAKQNLKMMDARGLGIAPTTIPAPPTRAQKPSQTITSPNAPSITKAPNPIERALPSNAEKTVPITTRIATGTAREPSVMVESGSGMPALNSNIAEPEIRDANAAQQPIAINSLFARLSNAIPQNPSLIIESSGIIESPGRILAILFSLTALVFFKHLIMDRKRGRARKIRQQFVQSFYEAKRSDLRLTYLRRRENDFIETTFHKEWHATLTVLMARYALNYDQPDEALKAFCKKLNHGLGLRLRPTQHLASEYSDEMMGAARSEIKAVDAFHESNMTDAARELSSKNIAASPPPPVRQNVVNLF